MAAQPSLREELDVLRRRAWERRNQEAQQDRELYQEITPLFGEPYKTNKGDELSRFVQRMLGNYEVGNNSQCSPYDGVIKDRPLIRSGRPVHKDKTDPSFQSLSTYRTGQSDHPGHDSGQPSKYHPVPQGSSLATCKEAHLETHQQKMDPWLDTRDHTTLPPVLPDLSPPAGPLSPLHSSESGASDQDTDNEHDHSLSPEHPGSSNRRDPVHHSESQKEVPQLTGDALPLVSQTFSLPLSSKSNLANTRKPMALVRPIPGLDQVTNESPDLKPSPEDFHRQSYETLPDLKSGSKPSLPPLKAPPQSIETLSNEVQDILKEMASWPPLLTAIHTPSTAEPKFSFPNNEPQVHPEFPPPHKPHGSSPKAPLSPCKPNPVVPVDADAAVLAPSNGGESGSSSDSGSSSESESDSESCESGTEKNPPVPQNTSPAKQEEDRKDISWLLGPYIKTSQPRPNPQNHEEIVPGHDLKTDQSTKPSTKPQPHAHPQEEPKPRNKRHHASHTPPAQVERVGVEAEGKSASQQADLKPVSKPADQGHRKNVGNKQPGRSSKAPRHEEAHASLQVESVEVTPRDKDSTFTDRPKVKTKSSRQNGLKSQNRKHGHSKGKKGGKEAAPKTTVPTDDEKEAPPSLAAPRSTSPPPKSTSAAEMTMPPKNPKKGRTRSPTRGKKSEGPSRLAPDPPQTLVVKIELSKLSRVPKVPKAAKASKGASRSKPGQEKEPGSAGRADKKRPAERNEPSVPKKKPKLEKEGRTSSAQLGSSKAEAPKGTSEDKERKNSKKAAPPPPHGSSQEQPKGSGHKRSSGDPEKNGHGSTSKRKKKSSSKEDPGKSEKKPPKSEVSSSEPVTSSMAPATHRTLMKFEDRQNSVDHHMKEAKRLKHKADVTLDKTGKALKYMEAVMSFVESGIAMEKDPQTPKSAFTMYSETLDLIRFTLRLKNFCDLSAPASERDFLVLCMRCQALLQMAMFRCKRESAVRYSRTLSEHFKNSKTMQAPSPSISKSTGTPSPMSPPMRSPASSVSSGLGSNPSSSSSSTVAIPQVIQQVASSYVNITALFLSAHETWEQAEELARKGSGMLTELDSTMGQLSLMSGMTTLVRYTRQGLHWLNQDTSNSR